MGCCRESWERNDEDTDITECQFVIIIIVLGLQLMVINANIFLIVFRFCKMNVSEWM